MCRFVVFTGHQKPYLQCNPKHGCGAYVHPGCVHVDPSTFHYLTKQSKKGDFLCPKCLGGDFPYLSQEPSSQVELCSVCHRKIQENDELITCDTCNQRSHRSTCNQLTKKEWRELTGPVQCWRCKVAAAREEAAGEVWNRLEALANLVKKGTPGIEFSEWDVKTIRSEGQVVGMLLYRLASLTLTPVIAKSLRIDRNGLMSVTISGHLVPADHPLLEDHERVDLADLPQAIRQIQSVGRRMEEFILCQGNHDESTMNLLRLGIINSFDETDSERFCIDTVDYGNGTLTTLRSSKCELMFRRGAEKGPTPTRCSECYAFRHIKRHLLGGDDLADASLPKKALVKKLQRAKRSLSEVTSSVLELKKQLAAAIRRDGRPVDSQLEELLSNVLQSHVNDEAASKLPPSTALFMLEQMRAVKAAGPTGRRWHPAFISFSLALRMRSSAAYDQLSKFVALPSARRLYDYSNAVKYRGGIDPAFIDTVLDEYKTRCSGRPLEKYVVLIMDSMYIQSGLAYESGTGRISGYSQLESLDQLIDDLARGSEEEPEAAKEVFTIMMKGIGVHFCRPIASWATKAASGQEIGSFVEEVVRVLWTCGIVAKGVVADGATSNFAFFDQWAASSDDRVEGTKVPWKCPHPYDRDEEILFFMDPPHLVKLNRNSLANSNAHENTRSIEKLGSDGKVQHMDWDMIRLAYQMDKRNGPLQKTKLTHAHVELNSYSKMGVRKAAQVCSATVADFIEELDEQLNPEQKEMSELVQYLRYADLLFDFSNIRHPGRLADSGSSEESSGEKAAREPFAALDDPRLDRFKEIQDWFFAWKEENSRRYSLTDYSHFISGQSFNMVMMNTTSVPAFIRWGLGVGFRYILTAVLSTDDVEALHAELRQARGSKQNPSVSDVFSTLPQSALAKQALKAVSLPKGTNIDPRLLADPTLSQSSAYAQRLVSVPTLPSRPRPQSMEESAARSVAKAPFEPKTFYGRMLGIVPHSHQMSASELKPHETNVTSKQELKTSWDAELCLLSPDRLSVYKLVAKEGKESRSLSFQVNRERFVGLERGSSERYRVLIVSSAEATSHPFHHIFFKLSAGTGDDFSKAISECLGSE